MTKINKWLNAVSNARYARMPGRNSAESLIGLSRISRREYAHIVWHMKEFTGKRLMRLDRGN
jgi:hypothetical protein